MRSVHGDRLLARPQFLVTASSVIAVLGLVTLASVFTTRSVAARTQNRTTSTAPSPTEDPVQAAPALPPVTAPTPAPATATAAPAANPPAQPGPPISVLFVGDSVSRTTAAGLVPLGPSYNMNIDNQGTLGCGVVRTVPFRYFGQQYNALPPGCDTWPDVWRASVERDHPDVVVIIVGRWELMDRVYNGGWTHIGDPAFDAYLASELDTGIVAAASTGAKVAVCTTPYYRRGLRPDGGLWPEDDPARVDLVNKLIRDAAARHPGVASVVDFGGHLSPGGQLAMNIDGVKIRYDGVHVTPEAGPWMAPWLLPQFHTIAGH